MSKYYERVDGFKVCYESKEDGHTVVDSYFTKYELADRRAKKVNGNILSMCFYRDAAGDFYEMVAKEIYVDSPEVADVLAKLSLAERRALGLK